MKRSRVRPKRRAPRRRDAPRWDWEQWQQGNQLLVARSEGACERCGDPRPYAIERHHRKRRRDGGDRLSNILLLCAGPEGCHGWVTEHPGEARRMGFIVSAYRDPVGVPVLWRRRVWHYLDDDGGKRVVDWVGDDAHE